MEVDQTIVAIGGILGIETMIIGMSYFTGAPVDNGLVHTGIAAIAGLAGYKIGNNKA